MIDTIKFLVPVDDLGLLEKLEGALERIRKEDLKTGVLKFEFHASNIPLGSHKRTVNIKSSKVPLGLFVEFSLPKYQKGNNVEMIHASAVPQIVGKLYLELCAHLGVQLPPVSTWPIYRLDICYNWLFDTKEEAMHAMSFVQRIDYPRKQKYIYDTSLMYRGSAYVIKFYAKGAEFRKHDLKELVKSDEGRGYELVQYADRIVRFEVGLKHAYLTQLFNCKVVYATDIADDGLIQDTLIQYLEKVFKYINPKMTSEAEVERVLFSRFSKTKALRLYQFWKGYYFDDATKTMYLRGGLHRSTIYTYKKDLKSAGIGYSFDDVTGEGILEKLTIPSVTTRFELLNSDTMPV